MKTDAPVLVIGSASVHVARFVRGLCAAGQSVVASTHGELAVDPHPALLATTTIDLGVRNWRAPKQIRELMHKWTPRIVHAHQANSVGWHAGRAVRGSGVPLVLTLWGSDVLLTPAISPLHRWMIKQALRSATAWTADSRIVLEAADALLGSRTAAARRVPVLSDLPANREWVVDGLNGFLVSDLDRLDQAMQQAIGLWESGQWAATGGAWNPQLIRRKATFTRNIEQFLALYAQLRAG